MLTVCSLAKMINLPGAPAILRGLVVSFIKEYESAIRAITVDLDLETFESFNNLYKTNLAALVKGSMTVSKPATQS